MRLGLKPAPFHLHTRTFHNLHAERERKGESDERAEEGLKGGADG